jgi:hypothetical protein
MGLCLILLPVSASARYAEIGQFGSWTLIKYTLDNGKPSCQAIQCRTEYCQNTYNLILVGSSTDNFPFLIFHSKYDYPLGKKAVLRIGGKAFTLINDDEKSKESFYPTSGRDAHAITVLLQKLSLTKGSKSFSITDHNGQRANFSANGTARAIERIHESCGTGMP